MSINTVAAGLIALMMSLGAAHSSSIQEIAESTFKLYNGDKPGCSATYVGSDEDNRSFLLTAAHCVDDRDELNIRKQVKNSELEVLSEEILYVNSVRTLDSKDIALLKVRDEEHSEEFFSDPVDVAVPDEVDYSIGNEVLVFGYPLGRELTLTEGRYTGVTEFPNLDIPMHRATPAVQGGSSGGGLYLEIESEWKLIGTTTGMIRGSEFMNYFTDINSVDTAVSHYIR